MATLKGARDELSREGELVQAAMHAAHAKDAAARARRWALAAIAGQIFVVLIECLHAAGVLS